ncbi:hypothetical protein [Pelagimonas varians]|uniref:Lipoprotein n=1 Tax=Pelagimonas varians TaxID=696760 RepID=A0A238K2T0_9RHOB|nr:hypothetical protein [Pelagimonas varians]PYG26981.1 hypothetical protein C8N36_1184 [Pelagimonas varians]SMX37218.1 hypothetical protein PEV8663_00977 [Pelagimonas varians]
MRLLASAACIFGLVGCASTPGADYILSLSADTQFEALRACHQELGIQAPLNAQRLDLNDGRVSIFAADGGGLTLSDARAINRCAQQRLLANQSSNSGHASVAPQPNTAIDYRAELETQAVPRQQYRSAYCPAAAPVLYGGTQICR